MFNFQDLKNQLEALQVLVVASFASTREGLEKLWNKIGAVRTELLSTINTKKGEAVQEAKDYTDTKISNEVTDRNAAIQTAVNTEVSDRNAAINTAKGEVNGYTDTKVSQATTSLTGAIATAKTQAGDYTDTQVSAATTSLTGSIATAKTQAETYAATQATSAVSTSNAYTDTKFSQEAAARGTLETTVNNRLSILESGNFGAFDDFCVLTLTNADGTAAAKSIATIVDEQMAEENKTLKANTTYIVMVEGNVAVEKQITYVNSLGQTVTVGASAGEQFVVKTNGSSVVSQARYVANPFMEAKVAQDAINVEIVAGLSDLKSAVQTGNADILVVKNAIKAMVDSWPA